MEQLKKRPTGIAGLDEINISFPRSSVGTPTSGHSTGYSMGSHAGAWEPLKKNIFFVVEWF